MSEWETARRIPDDDPVAVELRSAVHGGDIEMVRKLLRTESALVKARLVGRRGGT
jgi:uncharacterized protein